MEEVEHFIKLMQEVRLDNERKLKDIETESESMALRKKLQELTKARKQCQENIMKILSTVVGFKHSIHKIIHSSQDISGLPVPHDYAQDIKTMFSDVIEFFNNLGDMYRTLNNVEKNNVELSQLMETVRICTESVETELYQIRYHITQLETLKENIAIIEQYISNSSNDINNEHSINDGLMDN